MVIAAVPSVRSAARRTGRYGIADCQVSAGLRRSKTLLRQEHFTSEPSGIVGEDKR